ncbi:MAG: hypothetical protein LIO46_01605, partial [Clostridiales bacterium]|nr:hypothetical protein [Clostridiales bacterium]
MYQINKEKGHVLALPYDSEEEALARGANPYRQSLNGQWKFHWRMGLAGEPEGCTLPDYDDSGWGEMKVPAVWQMEEGYSYPYYYASTFTKAISRSKEKIPSIDHDMQEIGIYRRSFLLDSKWSGMEVFLHFGAAKSALELYVNGIFVGYSQGSMTPHEFKVTPYLQPGENQVTAKVYRYSDGTYLENQDMWNLCGIYRDTYLYAEKKACIRDFFFRCDLDEAYTDAQAMLDVCVNNYGDESRQVSVQAYLAQRRLQIGQENLVLVPGENTVRMQALVEKPDLWSAEHPNLYDLVVVLKDGEDILSVKTARVGFKKVEIQGEQILFNGKPLMLYGVNRHDFDPDSGWAVPRERFCQDLNIMKRHNINAIRTSHYPDDPFFYELCNEYGFYVMDECDLESHGVRRKGVPGSDPRWTGAVVDRMERMVLRDRNHPCV